MQRVTYHEPSLRPTNKVGTAVLSVAVTTLIAWGVEIGTAIEIPALVQGSITTIVTAVLSYLVPNSGVIGDDLTLDEVEELP